MWLDCGPDQCPSRLWRPGITYGGRGCYICVVVVHTTTMDEAVAWQQPEAVRWCFLFWLFEQTVREVDSNIYRWYRGCILCGVKVKNPWVSLLARLSRVGICTALLEVDRIFTVDIEVIFSPVWKPWFSLSARLGRVDMRTRLLVECVGSKSYFD